MSWIHVQDFGNTDPVSSGTGTAVSGSAVTFGNLLVVAAGNFSASLSGVTDSGSNSYTKLGSFSQSGGSIDLWYTVVTTSGTLTVSCAGQSYGSIACTEFNPGGGVISKASAAVTNHGTGTALTTGALSIATPSLVVAGFANGETAQAFTPFAGYTAGTNTEYSPGANVAVAMVYALAAATSAANPGGTLAAGTNSWAGVGCAFFAAADSAYDAIILAESSLLNYWEFDESAASGLSAYSKGGLVGTISTGAQAPTPGQAGLPSGGSSYLFNGDTSDHTSNVSVPSFSIGGVSGFSIECWIYFTSGRPGQTAQIIGFSTSSGSTFSGLLLMTNSNSLTFSVNTGSGNVVSNGNLSASTWHHLVVTVAVGGSVLMYVDGTQQTSTATAGTPANMTTAIPLFIGGGAVYAFDATFQITKPAIYNAPLSSARVTAHYNAGLLAPISSFAAALLAGV